MSTRIELSAGWVEVRCELDLATVSLEDLAFVADIAQLLQSRPTPDDGSGKDAE